MAYNNFSLQSAIDIFDLNLLESNFCESLPPITPQPEFLTIFNQYLPLAQKAKSEKDKKAKEEKAKKEAEKKKKEEEKKKKDKKDGKKDDKPKEEEKEDEGGF